ncbi:hypothetical protein COO59_09480 [Mixta theicola]|uniref:Uncharacterized protein n=1 Tax=Mixta theicola TaxID=1458355 RepID=A0A2K1Q9M1_9GAMM|nr:hypothetical protein [Mixta theicola]PNS11724.1 hypothetical protein COO59_09480 [Mixta theicola]GLR07636.1 hypothetical protein GCM10007905_03550 [Mixta theicola]
MSVKWIVRTLGFIILLLMLNLIVPQFISVDLQYRMAEILGVAGAEQVGNRLVNISFIISLAVAAFIVALGVIVRRGRKR